MKTVTIQGTPAQIEAKWTISGVVLTGSMISGLCKIGQAAGFARVVEEVKNFTGRGMAAKVWEITLPAEWNVQERAP